MARLVEDGNEDFPDLAMITRGHEEGHGRAERGLNTQYQRPKTNPRSSTISEWDSLKTTRLGEGKMEQAVCNPKLRRRVLNKISDNPLLRPFNSAKPATASLSLLKEDMNSKTALKQKLVTEKAKSPAKPHPPPTSDEDVCSGSDSAGLSDFIVNDSSYLSQTDSEGDMVPPPPRFPRKLARGLNQHEENTKVTASFRNPLAFRNRPDTYTEESDWGEEVSMRHNTKDSLPRSRSVSRSSGLHEPVATLSYSPPEAKLSGRNVKEIRFATPPSSPQKQNIGLISPKKLPRIPLTPHRPSMDGFWSQEIINEWNDEYSPRKTPKAGVQLKKGAGTDLEEDARLVPRKPNLKESKAVLDAKKDFNRRKHEIAAKFLSELDQKITGGQLALLSEFTGGVKIIWSKKLNTTAGRANWKRETIREKAAPEEPKVPKLSYRHHASIELSEKVIDDENRLLNVIAHEFCHLANFMISGVKNNPHGKEFKIWAANCSLHFGYRGIEVTTKHSYAIDYKYIWECTNCGTEFKRHSKSIDPTRHQCGSCKSKLMQTKPVPKVEGKLGEYQTFVKENMKRVREQNPGSPQKEVMALMGKLYQDFKTEKLKEGSYEAELREKIAVDTIDAVARKLDFLDLTSP